MSLCTCRDMIPVITGRERNLPKMYLQTAEAREVVDVCAMPARRMGCGMERRLVSGVESVGRGGEGKDAIVGGGGERVGGSAR